VDYKQALTFLPEWARGVQVFANASRIVRDGPVTLVSNLNPARNTASWGVSLTRKRFTTRFNWNYRASRINSVLTGNSIGPETYNYTPTRLTLDADGEFYFRKNLALFVNVRNLTDEPEVQEIYGPDTPAHARLRLYIPYGTLWTFGIKGSF
jgi:iron complex outermembrane recepter protein